MGFDPFGSFAAVVGADSLIQIFRHAYVESIRRGAEDVQKAHSKAMISYMPLDSLTLARDHSTRLLYVSLNVCLAARSVVMSEALHRAESNGDPNGIRTRVTAVKGRCPRPLDDRVSERQISGRRPALQVAFLAPRRLAGLSLKHDGFKPSSL